MHFHAGSSDERVENTHRNVIERGNLFEWYRRDEHTYTPDKGLVNYLCTLKRTRNTTGLERKRVSR